MELTIAPGPDGTELVYAETRLVGQFWTTGLYNQVEEWSMRGAPPNSFTSRAAVLDEIRRRATDPGHRLD